MAQIGSFREPVYVAGAPADPGRIFIVERAGTVRLVLNGRPQTRPFLDITRLVKSADGEQGLLGLAFSPDYASSGLFYVYYTTASNNIRILQYRRSAGNPNRADPASARVLLTIDHQRYTNHNGEDTLNSKNGSWPRCANNAGQLA